MSLDKFRSPTLEEKFAAQEEERLAKLQEELATQKAIKGRKNKSKKK